MTMKTAGATYADAGVDIEAGNELVERIGPLAKRTDRPGVVAGIGGFGALFDLKSAGYSDPVLVAATDGVGTKLRIAIETGSMASIGIDLVAMCVNDLICQGAEPLFFLDYFATGKLDPRAAAEVVEGIAHGCVAANCALIGGETAEMPGMYAPGDFDLAGFAVGAVERGQELPSGIAPGDVLLGLGSSGVHSNGFSLVRKLVAESGFDWRDPAPFGGGSLGAEFLAPTRIYVASALVALAQGGVRGLAHITGGGLSENLPRILPGGLGADVDLSGWSLPPVFEWLADAGRIEDKELLRTFNCGIGMVLIADAEAEDELTDLLTGAGEDVVSIGQVTGDGAVRFSGTLK